MNRKEKFKKFTESKKTVVANLIIALVANLFFFSEHTMLGFWGYFTFKALPYIIGALGIVSLVLSVILLVRKNVPKVLFACFCFNVFLCLLSVAYFFGMITYAAQTFLVEMPKILFLYAFIAIIIFLCFYHGKNEYKGKKTVAIVICAIMATGSVLCFTNFSVLKINYIDNKPVVYAVENDYQIVWTTAAKGTGKVTIGDKDYYDGYAGQMRSDTTVHKVIVPQKELDAAKSYIVSSRAMLSEQGFSGLLGYTVKRNVSFRPVNSEDGIQAYFLSDTHEFNGAPIKAASYYGDKLDFLVMGGDHANFLDDKAQFSKILNLGYNVTKGSRPIVFARGNHELKCHESETLDRYVGAQNEKFYYTFRLQNVWGIVLDLGEDHDDDWKEFYGTAIYKEYREEQIAFLDSVINNKEKEYEAEGVEYRLGICHAAPAVSLTERPYMYEQLVAMNERLNQMNLDVMLSGHEHAFYKIESGIPAGQELVFTKEYTGKENNEPVFTATGATYTNIICCNQADAFGKKKENPSKFTGAAIELKPEGKTLRFTTHKRKVVKTSNPFQGGDYGEAIIL